MEVIHTTCDDLKDFRKKGKSNDFYKQLLYILDTLPPQIRNLIDEDEMTVDYAITESKLPKNSLPYKLTIRKGSKKLNEYFNNYVFLVKWF